MLLAVRIAESLKEKDISQIQLAKILGKHHSVVTKWLSGTHNFTSDTLSDIEYALGISLFQIFAPQSINNDFIVATPQKIQNTPIKPEHLSDDANQNIK